MEQELIRKERSKKLSTQTNELEEKIQEIQKQAILQLKQARVKTEEKLKQMKKISERKKHDAKKQINNIRAKIATTILNEARIGNISLCNPKQLEEERWNYCDKNMKDDFERLDDCKNNRGDFCYTCCENEFGKIHEDMREDCYLKCDAFIDNPYIDWNEGIKYSQS